MGQFKTVYYSWHEFIPILHFPLIFGWKELNFSLLEIDFFFIYLFIYSFNAFYPNLSEKKIEIEVTIG